MKIAFGIEVFYPETNGVITATINLANNLIDMGHEVYFFVPKDKHFTDDVIEKGIHIIHVNNIPSGIYKGVKLLPYWGWYLAKYFKKYHFDIVHNTGPWMMGMALNHAARRFHVPVIATHHTLIDNPIYIKYALKTETLANAATEAIWPVVFHPFYRLVWLITAPSEATCEQLRERVPDHEVRYVSNGIDIDRFDPNRPTLPMPKAIDESFIGDKTFLFVGRLGFEKALDVTIKAFAECKKRNEEAKLLIIGRGPAEHELKEIARDEGLIEGKDILFTGLIPNDEVIGSKIINKTLCFVTASVTENQAMTVIEALCSGSAVICANVPNMTTLVSEDQGWYFEGGNYLDLADKMDYAFNHIEEVKVKRANALKSLEKFDGRSVAKQFEAIYKEQIERKNKGFYVPGGEKRAKVYLKQLEQDFKYY